MAKSSSSPIQFSHTSDPNQSKCANLACISYLAKVKVPDIPLALNCSVVKESISKVYMRVRTYMSSRNMLLYEQIKLAGNELTS